MVKKKEAVETPAVAEQENTRTTETPVQPKKTAISWANILAWGGTFLLVAVLLAVLFQFNPLDKFKKHAEPVQVAETAPIDLPAINHSRADFALVRAVEPDTVVPEGTRHFAIKYTVESGDALLLIADKFDITMETILYSNKDVLQDKPHKIDPGWQLTIPPTDGVYIKLKEGDTLEKVAEKYHANIDDIIYWPSNHIDIDKPTTEGLDYVMIPGGYGEISPWIDPLPYAPGSGATRTLAGGCAPSGYGGSGFFTSPTNSLSLSGFNFTSFHLGIDISARTGEPIYAADSGSVVYAGWNDSGYGNMVMIDHGNGYETLYAHLSQVYVSCGDGVYQGAVIGAAGETGRSYGSHLHFEVRYNGGFINPWDVVY